MGRTFLGLRWLAILAAASVTSLSAIAQGSSPKGDPLVTALTLCIFGIIYLLLKSDDIPHQVFRSCAFSQLGLACAVSAASLMNAQLEIASQDVVVFGGLLIGMWFLSLFAGAQAALKVPGGFEFGLYLLLCVMEFALNFLMFGVVWFVLQGTHVVIMGFAMGTLLFIRDVVTSSFYDPAPKAVSI